MTFPSQVTYGTVVGTLVTAQAATSESAPDPASVPCVGTVTFTPAALALYSVSSTPELIIVPQPITVTLDGTGSFTVDLIATDDPDLNPVNWAYTVSFALTGVSLAKQPINVPGGITTNLAAALPVTTVSGVAVVRGVSGDNGSVVTTSSSDSGTVVIGGGATATAWRESTITGNVTYSMGTPSPPAGETFSISMLMRQNSTGNYTVTWDSAIVWAQAIAPTLPNGPGAVNTVTLVWSPLLSAWCGYVGATGQGVAA